MADVLLNIKKTVNAVLDSKYERYTRLKKVFEEYSFNRTKHSRYHEGDADSLAVVLLKKQPDGLLMRSIF
jgi:hypothetical protein